MEGAVVGATDDAGFGLVLLGVLHAASDSTIDASIADAMAADVPILKRSISVSLAKCLLTLPHSSSSLHCVGHR